MINVTINPGRFSTTQYSIDAETNFLAAVIALEMFNNEKLSTGIFSIQCDGLLMPEVYVELIQELVRPSTDLNEVISACNELRELRLKTKFKEERKQILKQISENEMNIICLKEQLKYLDERIAE